MVQLRAIISARVKPTLFEQNLRSISWNSPSTTYCSRCSTFLTAFFGQAVRCVIRTHNGSSNLLFWMQTDELNGFTHLAEAAYFLQYNKTTKVEWGANVNWGGTVCAVVYNFQFYFSLHQQPLLQFTTGGCWKRPF